jgi:hypothetical protein
MLLLLLGCKPGHSNSSSGEPSFSDQFQAVAAGTTDEIAVSTLPLNDDHLHQLASAAKLRVLKIDHTGSQVTAAGIRHLAGLSHLEHLRIRGSGIDDAALAQIAKIEGLQILNIPRGEFTDTGLVQLEKLPKLTLLRFGSPQVTDAGMRTIAEFPALRQLHLIGVPLTDAALTEVAGMERLESFYVDDMRFSDKAWNALFKARPKDLHVHIDQAHHDRDPHGHPH